MAQGKFLAGASANLQLKLQKNSKDINPKYIIDYST
jgi:hypothetical protein